MRICCFGSLNLDMVFSVEEFVRPGETISSKAMTITPGGKGLNQAIAIRRSGQEVMMAGSIGEDGNYLRSILRESGVDDLWLRNLETETGRAVIQVNEAGENCIILFTGANGQNNRSFMREVLGKLNRGDFLVLQNEINDLEYLLRKAADKGLHIFLNPSPLDQALREAPLGLCHTLILNETEGEELSREQDAEKMIEKLNNSYPDTRIILTLGAKGVLFNAPEGILSRPAYAVQTIDTTGAGDAFTGYFIGQMAQGKDVVEAVDLAQKAAAIAVTRKGAAQSIPLLEEVLTTKFSRK